jgi:radical SAM protein with 4Fe4S-binding SPASM domain
VDVEELLCEDRVGFMRTASYKAFSLKFHKKNWLDRRPSLCQFELTFGCALRCKHCYTDCYNKAGYIRRELNTKEVKLILDKVHDRGILWLCLTGGDPLTRKDFFEIYAYAKNKGFIITIFTNAHSMTRRIAGYLKNNPPFVIEVTLNAVKQVTYEKITQVEGSFSKTKKGIDLILRAGLPLKIKTQVTKDNLEELPQIKKFMESSGLKFRPSVFLHNRINGDSTPSNLRISPQEVLSLNGKRKLSLSDCDLSLDSELRAQSCELFRCAVSGGDGIHIDPRGNIVPCSCIREPKVNLLKEDLAEARGKVLDWVRTRYFSGNIKCQSCPIRSKCYNCPGKALLETGNLEGIVNWYCDLAHYEYKAKKQK